MKPPPRPLVAVTWLDAVGPVDIDDLSDVDGLEPCRCVTVGFLLRDDRTALAIAGTEDYTDKPKTEFRDVTVIPRGMVSEVRRLTFRRPRLE